MANEDDAKACRFSDMIIPKRLCGGPVNSRLAISYALNDVLDNACYWTGSREFAGFFSNNRLLAIWNEYPELREKILNKLVIPSKVPRSCLDADVYTQQYKQIAKMVFAPIEKSLTLSDSKLIFSLREVLNLNLDYLGSLKSLSESPNRAPYDLWLKEGLKNSLSEDFFNYAFFSVKRAPGSTDIKREIIFAAMERGCLSDSIVNKVVKSSPITLKRAIVKALSNELQTLKWGKKDPPAQKIMDKVESAIILFAPVQDMEIQDYLVETVSDDNLVWLVPAISMLGHHWVSSKLERRLDQTRV